MRISCSGLELSEALARVCKAIPVRKTIPILEGIKMEAEGNKVCLYATDNNFTIKKTINATVYSEGEAVVSGKMFSDLIKKLSDSEVEIETGADNMLLITYPDGKTAINCYNYEEYPPVNLIYHENPVKIKQSDLKNMINKVIFCSSNDENMILTIKGCLLEVENESMCIVALDNCRMAYVKNTLERDYDKIRAVVPSKNLSEISRLLEDEDRYCDIYVTPKRILVDLGHTQIMSTLYDTDFFQFENMINVEPESEVVINKKQLETSLERAFIISRTENKNSVFLNIREDFIKIQSVCERGNITESIAASLKGKDIDIMLSAKYVLDCLRAVDDDFIRICMTKPNMFVAIKPVEGSEFVYIILPLTIDN